MSEKDFKYLMDFVQSELKRNISKEEALSTLVDAGILAPSGKLTKPYECLAVNSPR